MLVVREGAFSATGVKKAIQTFDPISSIGKGGGCGEDFSLPAVSTPPMSSLAGLVSICNFICFWVVGGGGIILYYVSISLSNFALEKSVRNVDKL